MVNYNRDNECGPNVIWELGEICSVPRLSKQVWDSSWLELAESAILLFRWVFPNLGGKYERSV